MLKAKKMENVDGHIELLHAVILNIFRGIKSPYRVVGTQGGGKNQSLKEQAWLIDIISWAKKSDNIWLAWFEEIFGYEKEVLANQMITQAEHKLSTYGL